MRPFLSSRWNILAYAIFLTLLAMSLGYVFLSKSEVLLENLTFQGYDSKMWRNLSAKADMALKWAASLNSNGGEFRPARACPASVTLSGTVDGSSLETVSTVAKVSEGRLYCEGVSAAGIPLRLDYSPDYSTFLTGTYVNSVNVNLAGTWLSLSGQFADPQGKFLSATVSGVFSEIDGDLDSDDFRSGSTGSVAYPSGYADDDADARKTAIGLVRADSGWNAALWTNSKTNAYVERNPYNSDSVNAKISSTSTGYLRFDVDRPFSLKVVEFDAAAYAETGELVRIGSDERTSATGAIGWLQNDLSFSGTRSAWDGAKAFDFKNRSYGIFISYPASVAGNVTHLKYRISGENESGSGLYLVPIDDSVEGSIRYLWADIVIDSAGNYRSKILDFSVPKTGVNRGWICQWTWGWPLDGACISPE